MNAQKLRAVRAALSNLALGSKLIIVVCVLMIPTLISGTLAQSADYGPAFKQGIELFAEADYEKAADAFAKAGTASPDDLLAPTLNAVCLANAGQQDLAISSIDKLLQQNPRYTLAIAQKATVLNEAGKKAEALRLLGTIETGSASTFWDWYAQGVCFMQRSEPQKAVEAFTKALSLKTDSVTSSVAYWTRGIAKGQQGNVDAELSDHAKAIELNPRCAVAWMNQGTAHVKKRDYQRAISSFDKAIEINPRFALAYVNRGAAWRSLNSADKAIPDYDKAISINPRIAMAWYNRGVAYRHKNNFDKAISDYTEAINLKSDYPEAYHSRGVAYQLKGLQSNACADWKKAYELDPNGSTGQSAHRNWLKSCN